MVANGAKPSLVEVIDLAHVVLPLTFLSYGGAGLENRHTGEPGIESSNLSLSVTGAVRPSIMLNVRELLLVAIAIAGCRDSTDPATGCTVATGPLRRT